MTARFEIRAARPEDLGDITPWTRSTFQWGDYVPDRFPSWLADPRSAVLVCTDQSDRPVALCHAVLLSDQEGWLEAARVHPAHRRAGLGSALNDAGVAWLQSRGARVVRLATEASNRAACSQVEKLRYRPVSSWHHGELRVDSTRRAPRDLTLRAVPPSEIDGAWVYWSSGDLAAAGRELIALGWQWRKTQVADLANAAATGSLFVSPAGWVIVDRPDGDWLRSGWMATAPEDAPRLFQGMLDLGADLGVSEISVMVPGVPWAVEAMARAGCRPEEVVVYAKSL